MPRVPSPLSSHCPGYYLFSCPIPGPHMARAVPYVHPSRLTSVFVQAGPARPLPAQLFVEPSPGCCLSSPATLCPQVHSLYPECVCFQFTLRGMMGSQKLGVGAGLGAPGF